MSWTSRLGVGTGAMVLVGACTGVEGPLPDAARDAGMEAAAADSGSSGMDAESLDAPATDTAITDSGPADAQATRDASDAARADASRDASTANRCASALFCEPFESYAAMPLRDGQLFGPWRAALRTPGSTMVLDGTHTVSGTRALHVHIDNAATAGGRLFSNGTVPVIASHPTHLYGRMMMYIEPNGTSIHWTFFGVNGDAEPSSPAVGRRASYLLSSLPRAGVNTFSFVDGLSMTATDPYHDCSLQSTTPMPTARWTCVSFEMDSVARRLRLTMDAAPTPTLALDDHGTSCVGTVVPDNTPWYGPAIDQFYTGAWSFHPMNAPLDVWLDDIILDTAPVPCP